MLAISRRPGQSIYIYPAGDIDPEMTVAQLFSGGPIKLTTDIRNGQIKIGIAAPRELTVLREELLGDGGAAAEKVRAVPGNGSRFGRMRG